MSPDPTHPFGSLYSHGFARVAAAVPHVRVGEPAFNAERTLALARRASDDHAALVVFPELGLSAYAIDDLFHQDALLDAVEEAIGADRGRGEPRPVAGARRRRAAAGRGQAVQLRGRDPPRAACWASCPRATCPNYREFYEKRQFTRRARRASAARCGCSAQTVPFGTDLVFDAPRPRRLRAARGDLRGRLDADPAEHLRRAGRRDGAGQPVGQQHHRSARPSTAATLCAAQSGKCDRRLPLHRRRAGRVDHRPGLGRPRADLRERRPAGRVASASPTTSS